MDNKKIAYFCMEFGLHESLTIFSGGLGVLAGDLLKAARDSDCPMVGVGILWDEGYTKQGIDEAGKPYDVYPKTSREALKPLNVSVSVTIEGRDVPLTAWEVEGFGNAPLYLLEPVEEQDRWITARLYAGGPRSRVAQELVLGVGGVRLLRALKEPVELYHFNEGHALFAGFELVAEKVSAGADLETAMRQTREQVVFTTHTPVKAGNEVHPVELLLEMGAGLGVFERSDLVALGGEPFEMTVAALRLSRVANAVAQLHGRTARTMWCEVMDAAPILSITNGVHMGTWQDGRIREVMAQNSTDEQLWMVNQELKAELISEVQRRTGTRLSLNGLLIGFARRAATYKRATLILRDLKWLEPLLSEGTVQLVFSGKAHPEDQAGKEILEEIVAMARRFPGQIVFLENYDMHLGRLLTRGCDIWLNTPTRPMEASGTSGMKAAANGVLNLSVLDGWWDEGCEHDRNGWQFGDGYEGADADQRDLEALQAMLSQKVLPTYYKDRPRWISMMRRSISTGQEQFSARRMLGDYRQKLYSRPA